MQEESQTGNHQVQVLDDEWKQLSKEEAASFKWQPKPVTIVVQEPSILAAKTKIQTGMVSVALLRPYAKNAEIYHEREDVFLLDSIRVNGVRNDLLADEDGVVYGGTTRLRYAREVGLTEVPVKVIAFQNDDEKLLRLLDDNLYRRKTNVEETREYMARKSIEARAALRRKAEASKKHGKPTEEVQTITPLPAKKGKTRDLASEGSGRTGVSLEKGCKIVEAADKVRKEGDGKTADELLAKLDKDGYTPALKLAESLNLVPKPQPKGGGVGVRAKGKGGAAAQAAEPPPVVQKPINDPAGLLITVQPVPEPDTGAVDTEDHPPVVRIIAACDKLADDLDRLTVADLTAGQKGSLYHVLERVANWLALHDEVLQVPARK